MNLVGRMARAAVVGAVISAFACGGGASSSGSGSAGLGGPNPEDVFDLPNTLPNDFALAECAPITGVTNARDLNVVITSPNAPQHDYDGDGDMDSILLFEQDPSPKTVTISLEHRTGTALPPTILDLTQPRDLIFGRDRDENNVRPPGPIAIAYGQNLLQDAWVPPYRQPIVRMDFIPGNPGSNTQPPFSSAGFEGCDPFFPPPTCVTGLSRGVYVVHGRFVDTNAIQHCTEEAFRILVCPVAGHC